MAQLQVIPFKEYNSKVGFVKEEEALLRKDAQVFKDIQVLIESANGCIPADHEARKALTKFVTSCGAMNLNITLGLTRVAATTIKLLRLIQQVSRSGLNEHRKKSLKEISGELTVDTVKSLEEFIKSSHNDIATIITALMQYGGGDRLIKANEEKNVLLDKLAAKLRERNDVEAEKGRAEANIRTAEFRMVLVKSQISDVVKAKQDLQAKIDALSALILQVEQEVVDHRNTTEEQYGRLWIFSWHERTVHHDNGEHAYRRKLDNLKSERSNLQNLAGGMDKSAKENQTLEIEKLINAEKSIVKDKKGKSEILKKEIEGLEKSINALTREIEDKLKVMNLSNTDAVKAIEELCRGIEKFRKWFYSAFASVNTRLLSLTINEDIDDLVDCIEPSLNLLLINDVFQNTRLAQPFLRELEI